MDQKESKEELLPGGDYKQEESVVNLWLCFIVFEVISSIYKDGYDILNI